MTNNDLQIKTVTTTQEMQCKAQTLLRCKISHPSFISSRFYGAAAHMNHFYRAQARAFSQRCRDELFAMAVEQYEDSTAKGYPVRVFEAVETFEVTYNRDCVVSLWIDRYEYTGGAHGNTVRTSNTWNLRCGCRMKLEQMFTLPADYKDCLTAFINGRIAAQIAAGENVYFQDYKTKVAKAFDPENFYLTPQGIVIFFPLYTIAPYAAGIRTFTLPYGACCSVNPLAQ